MENVYGVEYSQKLGQILWSGDGVPLDKVKAIKLFRLVVGGKGFVEAIQVFKELF
jgi:hypothetical protein